MSADGGDPRDGPAVVLLGLVVVAAVVLLGWLVQALLGAPP